MKSSKPPDIYTSIRNNLWIPDDKFINIESHSWFNIKEQISTNGIPYKFNLGHYNGSNNVIRAKRIEIYPSIEQKKILDQWFECYRKMYNETLKLIKHRYFHNNNDNILNFKHLRTNYLKETRNKIKGNSKIPIHTLDNAIKDVCIAYKSAISNYKNKNINKFKLRYIKETKKIKTLVIEAHSFSKTNNTFCSKILGKNIKTEDNYNIKGIEYDCRLQKNKNKYFLFVPIEKQVIKKTKRNTCGVDLGIRTFATCYTTQKVTKIGNYDTHKIKILLTAIDKINNNKNLSKKIISRATNKRYEKIRNYVADLHWKTAKYLCKNNNGLIIGEISTKSIVSNEKSKLNDMTKRVAYQLSFYKFFERIKSKAEEYGIICKIMDESYTSKTCSKCGNIKQDLGSDEVYECKKCKMTIDRDINAARNILIKGIK
jgi:IS605 OrfB family transposase